MHAGLGHMHVLVPLARHRPQHRGGGPDRRRVFSVALLGKSSAEQNRTELRLHTLHVTTGAAF